MPPWPLGNIELVPTPNTPQPQAQAWTTPGVKIPANKPLLIFTVVEFNFIFVFKLQSYETPQPAGLKG